MTSQIGKVWTQQLGLGFNGTKARAILGSFAALLIDKAIDWGTAGVSMRFPVQADGTPGDPAALALLANERGLIIDPAATTATVANILQYATVLHRLDGTALGMLVALYHAGFPGAVLVQQNGRGFTLTDAPVLDDLVNIVAPPDWFAISTLGPNPAIPASTDGRPAIAAGTVPWWTFDSGMDGAGNQFTSRFGVLFPAGGPDPGLGTAANLARIRRVIAQVRPAKATCVWIRVVTSGRVWGWPPTLQWGAGGLNWGGAVTSYTP